MTVPKRPSAIADQLQIADKIRSRSQAGLAAAMRVNQSTISRILCGRFKRLNKTVLRLCNYAKVDAYSHELRPAPSARIAEAIRALEVQLTPQKEKVLKILRIASELLDEN